MTNLTMLFNVLLTTLLSFFMASGHASNNPFQVVYFFFVCFQIKFSAYPNFGDGLVFSVLDPRLCEASCPLLDGRRRL